MNKYGNKKSRCLSQHVHDSKGEAGYCNRLLAMRHSGEIHDYFIQQPFILAPGIKHVVDFVVVGKQPLGVEISVHEFKGVETQVWRIKRKLFKEKYPHWKYIVIKKEDGYGVETGVRSKKRNGCDHGEGLKRHGVCVICRGAHRQKRQGRKLHP